MLPLWRAASDVACRDVLRCIALVVLLVRLPWAWSRVVTRCLAVEDKFICDMISSWLYAVSSPWWHFLSSSLPCVGRVLAGSERFVPFSSD